MKITLPILGTLLAVLSSATSTPLLSPTPTPTTLPPNASHRLSPRADDYKPSIPSLSLDLPTISIAPPNIPSLSLNLPQQTCTPGAPSYATPSSNGYVPAEACNALWLYSPKFGLAIAFASAFGMLAIGHLIQAVLYRNTYCWVVIMAAIWEAGAYAFRAVGSKDQQSSGIATVAQILVLVAPILVNAFAYMVFARVVHFYSPTRKVWIFSPSSLALIFVTLDLVAFIIQLIGGGMAGPGSDAASQKRGLNLYMAGIGVQEAFIVCFTSLIIKFNRDQRRSQSRDSPAPSDDKWKWLLAALYLCLIAITIRIVYRLIEFSAGLGASNPLPSNEPLLYVLESTPMFIAIGVWNIVHPGRYIYGEAATMPPSPLTRVLCCRPCRERRKVRYTGLEGGHERLADHIELEDKPETLEGGLGLMSRVGPNTPDPFLNPPTLDARPVR